MSRASPLPLCTTLIRWQLPQYTDGRNSLSNSKLDIGSFPISLVPPSFQPGLLICDSCISGTELLSFVTLRRNDASALLNYINSLSRCPEKRFQSARKVKHRHRGRNIVLLRAGKFCDCRAREGAKPLRVSFKTLCVCHPCEDLANQPTDRPKDGRTDQLVGVSQSTPQFTHHDHCMRSS